ALRLHRTIFSSLTSSCTTGVGFSLTQEPRIGNPPRTARSSSVTVASPHGKMKIFVLGDQNLAISRSTFSSRLNLQVDVTTPSKIPISCHAASCLGRSFSTHL